MMLLSLIDSKNTVNIEAHPKGQDPVQAGFPNEPYPHRCKVYV